MKINTDFFLLHFLQHWNKHEISLIHLLEQYIDVKTDHVNRSTTLLVSKKIVEYATISIINHNIMSVLCFEINNSLSFLQKWPITPQERTKDMKTKSLFKKEN